MIKVSELKLSVLDGEQKLLEKARKKSGNKTLTHYKIIKKSLDARDKGNLVYSYTLLCDTKEIILPKKEYPKTKSKSNILVVGAGPSGLFCALDLLRYGFNVTLIERGDKVEDREKKVNGFIQTKILDEDSNVQFGEGGAGAFSDGKLNTQVNSEYVNEVIADFVTFGAPKEIEYLQKPHVGSDNLPKIVKNIRNEIISLGGKVLFNTKLQDIIISGGKIRKVAYNGSLHEYDEVVLCVGHSARDIFSLLYEKGIFLESKNFAVGLRIEHLQKDINESQYGDKYAKLNVLPPAEYKLVSHKSEKGVFTFCMCPGGVVIPSASSKNTIVSNGMSNFKRDGKNSNSAVIVQVDSSDYGEGLFDGVKYQEKLEKQAFILGGEDYKAPVQTTADYLKGIPSTSLEKVEPTYQMGYKLTNLSSLFSSKLNDCLKKGIIDMSNKLRGFDGMGSVLSGVESRTSSPIKVTRTENCNSVNCENLYPCGEGCGYAGGIASAGADGKRVAKSIYNKYNK